VITRGAIPVPVKVRVCGLPAALSLSERLPDAAPPAVGVNVTATVQLPAPATGVEVEQVVPDVAMAKGPVAPMAVSVRLALPVLVRVTVWGLLVVPTNSDEKLGGDDRLTAGPVPIPMRPMLGGLLPASLVIVIDPVRVPLAVGVKVTLMVQLAPAFTVLPQVFVWAKSPFTAMLVMVSAAFPIFVSVVLLAGEVVPIF
jgi:hypothetical protein